MASRLCLTLKQQMHQQRGLFFIVFFLLSLKENRLLDKNGTYSHVLWYLKEYTCFVNSLRIIKCLIAINVLLCGYSNIRYLWGVLWTDSMHKALKWRDDLSPQWEKTISSESVNLRRMLQCSFSSIIFSTVIIVWSTLPLYRIFHTSVTWEIRDERDVNFQSPR